MPDVLIRNVPERVLERLKRRAAHHHRSLQGELMTVLELAASETGAKSPADLADEMRRRLASTGRTSTDSTPLIREDRER